jgi:hypothetical protein
MQYKTILRSYDLSSLTGKSAQLAFEMEDWNNALNKYAKERWAVINSGVIESGSNIIFWVLLEKAEQEEAINTGF